MPRKRTRTKTNEFVEKLKKIRKNHKNHKKFRKFRILKSAIFGARKIGKKLIKMCKKREKLENQRPNHENPANLSISSAPRIVLIVLGCPGVNEFITFDGAEFFANFVIFCDFLENSGSAFKPDMNFFRNFLKISRPKNPKIRGGTGAEILDSFCYILEICLGAGPETHCRVLRPGKFLSSSKNDQNHRAFTPLF